MWIFSSKHIKIKTRAEGKLAKFPAGLLLKGLVGCYCLLQYFVFLYVEYTLLSVGVLTKIHSLLLVLWASFDNSRIVTRPLQRPGQTLARVSISLLKLSGWCRVLRCGCESVDRLTSHDFSASLSTLQRHCFYWQLLSLTFFSPPPGLCCALSKDPTFDVTFQSSFFDSICPDDNTNHSPVLLPHRQFRRIVHQYKL